MCHEPPLDHPLRVVPRDVLELWPPRWRDVAREIMRLPVTVRDEPAAVSGEIAA